MIANELVAGVEKGVELSLSLYIYANTHHTVLYAKSMLLNFTGLAHPVFLTTTEPIT